MNPSPISQKTTDQQKVLIRELSTFWKHFYQQLLIDPFIGGFFWKLKKTEAFDQQIYRVSFFWTKQLVPKLPNKFIHQELNLLGYNGNLEGFNQQFSLVKQHFNMKLNPPHYRRWLMVFKQSILNFEDKEWAIDLSEKVGFIANQMNKI